MRKLIVTAILAALALSAADSIQKMVPVKNANAHSVWLTLREVMKNTPIVSTEYQSNIVLSGPPEVVNGAEQLIKSLDVAGPRERTIELTGYIILASQRAGEQTAVPPELEPVLKQFRSVLSYKTFRVLDTLILHGRAGGHRVDTSGVLALPNTPGVPTYGFGFFSADVMEGSIRFSELRLSVRIPTGEKDEKGEPRSGLVNIGTDVDVKPGQKVAIGKASFNTSGDAIILVISANVVD
ncbi:MAG TPA: hypothetical protein VKU01_01215 [Bryobacteraceae bacterium]|nr:hypothetical protein [Bryobacteraceae bacterium]